MKTIVHSPIPTRQIKVTINIQDREKPSHLHTGGAPLDVKAHGAARAEEKLSLGGAYQDEDLVFARADGLSVDPWTFGRALLDCIRRTHPKTPTALSM